MAEWLKAPVLKTGRDESPSWVRIPPPPFLSPLCSENFGEVRGIHACAALGEFNAHHISVARVSDIEENRSKSARVRPIALVRRPTESLRRPTLPEFGESYPGAIYLGSRIIAVHSPTIPERQICRSSPCISLRAR